MGTAQSALKTTKQFSFLIFIYWIGIFHVFFKLCKKYLRKID